jgi:bifunctional non-homologous end joining protein LigD
VSGPTVEVDGRQLSLSNLDKVLYPEAGFTKGEVIHYYATVAPTLLVHTRGRCVTFRRFPDGVEAGSFFEKRCPSHRPDWVPTAVGPGDRNGTVDYCLLEEPAAVVWAANLAALELHTPMARAEDLESPTMVVFDLDPGPGTGLAECAELALELQALLAGVDLEAVARTSGSKGMQVYVPLNTPHTHDHAADFARAAGQVLERRHPRGVTTTMAKAERPGKVFVDWSQNSRHKTTICAYSLRARPRPTVSTPLAWDEVAAGADGDDPLVYEAAEVLARVSERGDLFAPTQTLVQQLPVAG